MQSVYVQKASDIDHKSSVLNKHLQKSSVCIFKEIIHAQFLKNRPLVRKLSFKLHLELCSPPWKISIFSYPFPHPPSYFYFKDSHPLEHLPSYFRDTPPVNGRLWENLKTWYAPSFSCNITLPICSCWDFGAVCVDELGCREGEEPTGEREHTSLHPLLCFIGSSFLNNVLLLSYFPHHTHTHLTQQTKNLLSSTSKSLGLKIFTFFRPYPILVINLYFTVYGGCLQSCPVLKRNQNAAMS